MEDLFFSAGPSLCTSLAFADVADATNEGQKIILMNKAEEFTEGYAITKWVMTYFRNSIWEEHVEGKDSSDI